MQLPQILLQKISYALPGGRLLFDQLSLNVSQQKTGLIGRNGMGKSTLLRLIVGELSPSFGMVQCEARLMYVPQDSLISANRTIAEELGFAERLAAFYRISAGSLEEADFIILNDDWDINEKFRQQLALFGLERYPFDYPIGKLSQGELTRLLLTKAFSSNVDFLLLDEPTNHLDQQARNQLYSMLERWSGGAIIISHDRNLLNLMDNIVELTSLSANSYGGNYEHYLTQKALLDVAKTHKLDDAKKQLQQVKNGIQSAREKHEKKRAQGKKLFRSGSIDKLTANSKRGRSERTKSKMLIKEQRLLNEAQQQLQDAKERVEIVDTIHVELPKTWVPHGKKLLEFEEVTFTYSSMSSAVICNYNFCLQGPERVAVIGNNGSGKTTLVKLIMGQLTAQAGIINVYTQRVCYLDQNVQILNANLTVIENFLLLNPQLSLYEAHSRLAKFLFKNQDAHKIIKDLSGGEKLRAALACVLLSETPPQLLILDEPTNHLDLASVIAIEALLKSYQGAMIVITHDQMFIKNLGINRVVSTPFKQ